MPPATSKQLYFPGRTIQVCVADVVFANKCLHRRVPRHKIEICHLYNELAHRHMKIPWMLALHNHLEALEVCFLGSVCTGSVALQ